MRNLSNILLYETMPIYEGMVDSMIYKIKDKKLQVEWQKIFDKAKQVFSNRMDYVNWFFEKEFKISTEDINVANIYLDVANIYLNKFKELYDLDIQSINKISIIKYNDILDVFSDMYDARELYFKKLYKNAIPIEKTKKATKLFICSDQNFIWFDLHTKRCEEEHVAMGHCGSDETGDTLWSLREKVFVGSKLIGYKPHVTATYHNNDKRLSQVKGRENIKPVKKYHKFIKELIYAGLVKDFGGGAYKPEEDFGWDDFSKEEIEQIVKDKINNDDKISGYLIKIAYSYGLNKLIKKYINLKAYKNYDEIFSVAIQNGYIKIVKMLLEAGAINDYALIQASEKGYLEIVKLLLKAGADIHAGDDNALIWASIGGYTRIVKLLLDAGADIHAQDERALVRAIDKGHVDVVKLLLDAGANVHARDDIALALASVKGRVGVVKLLKQYMKNEK